MRALVLRFGMAVFLSAVTVPAAMATDATVVADASVNAARPNLNFGTLSNLYVGNGNTTLIQFDLSSLPAGTTAAQIGHAALRLYINRVNTSGTINLQPVTSAWGEFSVTSATLPTLGAAASSFAVSGADQYTVIDITTLVQGWLTSPGSNFGIALSSASANVLFDSKENDETSHVAQLDITVTSQGPVGPAGPAGVAGLQGVQGVMGVPGITGPQGAPGVPGVAGLAGPVGPTGATGATGSTGPAGAAGSTGTFSFASNYAAATIYAQGQVAFCATSCSTNGSSYISLVNGNAGFDPPASTAQWALIAEAGAIGAAGAVGPAGPLGPAGPTGLAGAPGPQGPAGSQGATGSQGSAGPAGTTGPSGPQGPAGPQGAAGTFSFASNYTPGTTYSPGQVVFCATTCSTNGSSYISLVNGNTGFDPPTSNARWALIAEAGATGSAGAAGSAGPSGPTGATGATGPAGPAGGSSHIFMASVILGQANTATQYFSLGSGGEPSDSGSLLNYNQFATTFPQACTFDSMFLTAGQSAFGNFSSPITITLFRNGVATVLTKGVAPPSTNMLASAQITGQSVVIAAGDMVALQATSTSFTTNATFAPVANVSVSLHCQ